MKGFRISSFTDGDECLEVKLRNRGGWMVPNHWADLLQNRTQALSINPTAESGSRAHSPKRSVG